ncbi:hypothetical protein GLOTRDRAFT_90590 [Gloeophyllum trabeum ATCC 11539]|uniref:Uncharacterized protein n=1 Tax=Gloeophyllum trabeum (strain ATCC 11539 / FP-39264 / Madison 617) TaxID=670483 RepID=S7RVH5_GLOTA|nr:uncharacterized protein GLOTRDRAFT_90590 [Gloeophyllum trabeum ATCC 11539]EPQ58800.1 hypothetical protein GLOTRDRAFT_90590 [Gloeophyllum trabeum ATCC 11539]
MALLLHPTSTAVQALLKAGDKALANIWPQNQLIRQVMTNNNEEKTRMQIPDIGLVVRKLAVMHRGFIRTVNWTLLVVVENKGIPLKQRHGTLASLLDFIDAKITVMECQVMTQVQYAFKAGVESLDTIVAYACIGEFWKLFAFQKSDLSPLSSNEDENYHPDSDLSGDEQGMQQIIPQTAYASTRVLCLLRADGTPADSDIAEGWYLAKRNNLNLMNSIAEVEVIPNQV